MWGLGKKNLGRVTNHKEKAVVKKRWARLLSTALSLALAVALLLPDIGNVGKVQAQGTVKEIANVVIFVKFKDDLSDVLNAVNSYPSSSPLYRSNWQEIKKMYDLDRDSFSNYITAVTEGKVHVTNYFPQERADGKGVEPLTLPWNKDGGGDMVEEVMKAVTDGRIPLNLSTCKLDNLQPGVLDNLTIIIQGNITALGDTAFHSSQYVSSGNSTFKGLRVKDYIMIPSNRLVSENAVINTSQQQGVIAHEFLHALGLPDLYRQDSSGEPVGQWDIMASVSSFLQYPLSYLRYRQGWLPAGPPITQSGTYTLTAVSGTGGDKLFMLKTPLSDTEFICLEYRKKSVDPYQFEYRIPTSGLLMYRVDTKVAGLTNNNREHKNYLYVYRPGVTDPELGADKGTFNGMTDVNLSFGAALDVSAGETSYGSTDLNADFTQNTLYYSNGINSGIQISGLKLSPDQNQLTFTVTFADYSDSGVWDKLEGDISGQSGESPDICVDPVTGTLYAAYSEEVPGSFNMATRIRVKCWDGTAWRQVGQTIDNARMPAVAVCGGEVYLSYCKSSQDGVVYCKLGGNTWAQVASYASQQPKSTQFVVDGDHIYGAFQETYGGGVRLVIYDIKGARTVTQDLTTSMDFGNPALVKSGDSFYMACAEFPSGSSQIREYNMATGQWRTVYTVSGTFTNTHQIVKQGQKLYVFAGYSVYPDLGQAHMAVFDGNSWSSSPVVSMQQFNWVSMDVVDGQVYLAYYDISDRKAKLLQGTGTVLQLYNDMLGTGLDYLKICSYKGTIYAATRAENTGNLVVRRKIVSSGGTTPPETQTPRLLTLTPPAGYEDHTIYVDGVEHTAQKTGGSYRVELPDTLGKTAVMYSYNDKNVPVGMYVWKLEWQGEICKAVPMPGLQDLLSYHGFSIRVQSPAGIRFKSGIDESLKRRLITGGVDGCVLKEYGTLFITNENRDKYPFIKGGTKVGGGRAYWTENGKVNDKVFETVAGRNRFTSVLINLAPNMYAKDISFRAYAVMDCGGQEIIIYGPPVYRSVYTVAKQVQAKGEFKVGSSGYKYVQGIIDSVEGR